MRTGKHRATGRAVVGELRRRQPVELDGTLHVAELAAVEVAVVEADPAEERIADGLEDALACDDPPPFAACFGCLAGVQPAVCLEDRAGCLLHLDEERFVRRTEQEHDVAPRAYAADADDAQHRVDNVELFEQDGDIRSDRQPVHVEQESDPVEVDGVVVADHGKLVDDPVAARFVGGCDLGKDLLRRTPLRFVDRAAEHLLASAVRLRFQRLGFDPEVEAVERRSRRTDPAARCSTPPRLRRAASSHCSALNPSWRAPIDHARDEPLDVPLPRPERGLVEIVEVEHHAPLGRCIQAEI